MFLDLNHQPCVVLGDGKLATLAAAPKLLTVQLCDQRLVGLTSQAQLHHDEPSPALAFH